MTPKSSQKHPKIDFHTVAVTAKFAGVTAQSMIPATLSPPLSPRPLSSPGQGTFPHPKSSRFRRAEMLRLVSESSKATFASAKKGPLAASFLDELSGRLIGDEASNSDGPDGNLTEDCGIEMIAPNRRKRSKTQDAAPCAANMRWKIERLFRWMHNFGCS